MTLYDMILYDVNLSNYTPGLAFCDILVRSKGVQINELIWLHHKGNVTRIFGLVAERWLVEVMAKWEDGGNHASSVYVSYFCLY